jgi:CDP-paratose 2-epimerase
LFNDRPASHDVEIFDGVANDRAKRNIEMRSSLKALVTGSGGLVGSACVEFLADQGWEIVGIDNNMRGIFFGALGSTAPVIEKLSAKLPLYRHHSLDIRDREKIRDVVRIERPDFIIHTAAQPSHDKAASIPYEDFDVNAVGTLNILVAAKDYCADSPICFTSTNKVYGDRPNSLPLEERATRYDYADGRVGIDENLSIDASLHSLFGASKVAADVLCQEFGLYFGMPIGIFRCGCLTGPQHAAVELHGFLTYIIMSAFRGADYTIFGYKGKQVRDQIHCNDVASLFFEYYKEPRRGEVYNLGGGRENSLSILETIEILHLMGFPLRYQVQEANRIGDHICYISDLTKLGSHFPDWHMEYDIRKSIEDILKYQYDASKCGSMSSL